MFLLIPEIAVERARIDNSLHSTMFLLIRALGTVEELKEATLHSTMFLLIPVFARFVATVLIFFTFHNVSINSS